jgi:hypothetical protein
MAALLFAIIKPSESYWAWGFPVAIICVFVADFVLMWHTALFIARVALPGKQSVASALFQTIASLSTSFELAITTIGQIVGMNAEARRIHQEIRHLPVARYPLQVAPSRPQSLVEPTRTRVALPRRGPSSWGKSQFTDARCTCGHNNIINLKGTINPPVACVYKLQK